jgi:hypothetical protein
VARPLRVAFLMSTAKFLRLYGDTIDALLAEGHEVVLGISNRSKGAEALETLEGRPRRPRVLGALPRRTGRDGAVAREFRHLADYARYLEPRLAHVAPLRENHRVRLMAWSGVSRLLARFETLPAPIARVVLRALAACERALGSHPPLDAFLRDLAPDVVLVTPQVMANAVQADHVKSARALGIPSATCVASWDNLTTKGLLLEPPDRLIVWNEAQRREAADLHGFPPDRVVVTGAQAFDRWFGRGPTADRETFCRRVGLDPERPFVLFAGSQSNGWPGEIEDAFVPRWAAALRGAADPQVARAGILFRPHPARTGTWAGVSFDDVENAALWPPERPSTVAPAARGEYFDSLYHAAAIVGINTSAMVEGAIIDRPVLVVRAREFELLHDANLHFGYLLPEHGGFLHVAADLGEHAAQLAEALAHPERSTGRNRGFVEAFIRPHGLDRTGSAELVRAIAGAAEVRPAPPPRPPPGGRALLAALRLAVTARAVRRGAAARADRALQAGAGGLERHGVPGAVALRALQRPVRAGAREKRHKHAHKTGAVERRERLLAGRS